MGCALHRVPSPRPSPPLAARKSLGRHTCLLVAHVAKAGQRENAWEGPQEPFPSSRCTAILGTTHTLPQREPGQCCPSSEARKLRHGAAFSWELLGFLLHPPRAIDGLYTCPAPHIPAAPGSPLPAAAVPITHTCHDLAGCTTGAGERVLQGQRWRF